MEDSAAVLPPLSDLVKNKVQPHEVRYILLDGGNSQLKWAWVDGAQQLHFGGRAPYANLQAFADFMAGQAKDMPIIGDSAIFNKEMWTEVKIKLFHNNRTLIKKRDGLFWYLD